MASLAPDLRRFLIKISLLENCSRDLLLKISGEPALIKKTEGVNSFINYDSSENLYGMHRLFKEYLTSRQNELDEDEKKEVWETTASWSAANNRKTDTVTFLEKAKNYNGIINYIQTLPIILATPLAHLVLELFDRGASCRDHPEFIIVRSRALISLGYYEQCRTELHENLLRFKSPPKNSGQHLLVSACSMYLGFISFLLSVNTGRYDYIHFFKEAAAELKLARKTFKGKDFISPRIGISIGFHLCRVTDPSPNMMEKCIAAIGEISRYQTDITGESGIYELARGELSLYRNRPEEAEKYLLTSLKKSREGKQYEIETRTLCYLLRIHVSRGETDKIEETLKMLEALLDKPDFIDRSLYYDIVTAWYFIQTDRKEKVAPWLKNDLPLGELNDRNRGPERLIRAKYCFSAARYQAALAILENNAGQEVFIMGSVEIKALEAVCRYRLSDKEGAYRALKQACSLSEPAGLTMPFIELGKDMRALTEVALADKPEGLVPDFLEKARRGSLAYAKKIHRQSGQKNTLPGEEKSSSLSRRETEVLKGFSRGLTREEIADAASISPNTVKSVARSIYNKLGALNQADAVRIATAMGILP